LRRYDDEIALFNRAAAANPSTAHYAQLVRTQIEIQRGDLKTAGSLLSSLPPDYDPNGATTWTRILLALYQRDPDAASRVLAAWKKEDLVGGAGKLLPVNYWQGVIARAKGDGAATTEAFTRARATIDAQLTKQPDDAILLVTLGLVDAGLGHKEEAVREGKHAAELRPLNDDAVDGATVLSYLAMIYAWAGDTTSAMDQLEFLARIPNGPAFGQLKFDPAWDGVRDDPRFIAMLKEIQPRPKEPR